MKMKRCERKGCTGFIYLDNCKNIFVCDKCDTVYEDTREYIDPRTGLIDLNKINRILEEDIKNKEEEMKNKI